MQSVMSLQKITLFYWGQNRLLNILPFIVSFLESPTWNLYVILLISALAFFTLLFMISFFVKVIIDKQDSNSSTFQLFLIINFIFFYSLKSSSVAEIVIWHFEYTLPLVFLLTSFYLSKYKRVGLLLNLVSSFFILIAIGINPSTLLLLVYIDFISNMIRQNFKIKNLWLSAIGILSFLIWSFISSSQQSGPNYGKFNLNNFYLNVVKTLESIGDSLQTNFGWFLIIIMFLVVFKFYKTRNIGKNKQFTQLVVFCCIFSVGWVTLFSQSEWVAMNLFSWRYFTNVYFSVLILITLIVGALIMPIKSLSLQVALVTLITIQLVPSKFVPIQNWPIFETANSISQPDGVFYAGDYWIVWPTVYRDMMMGHKAYGIAYRGESNQQNVKSYAKDQIIKNGYFTIICLNSSVENCEAQTKSFKSSYELMEFKKIKEGVFIIKMSDISKIEKIN
jgi:hypothetical protein